MRSLNEIKRDLIRYVFGYNLLDLTKYSREQAFIFDRYEAAIEAWGQLHAAEFEDDFDFNRWINGTSGITDKYAHKVQALEDK